MENTKDVPAGFGCPVCAATYVYVDSGSGDVTLLCRSCGRSSETTREQYNRSIAWRDWNEKCNRAYRVSMEFPQSPDFKTCHWFDLTYYIENSESMTEFKARVIADLRKKAAPYWCAHGREPSFSKR